MGGSRKRLRGRVQGSRGQGAGGREQGKRPRQSLYTAPVSSTALNKRAEKSTHAPLFSAQRVRACFPCSRNLREASLTANAHREACVLPLCLFGNFPLPPLPGFFNLLARYLCAGFAHSHSRIKIPLLGLAETPDAGENCAILVR